MRKSLAVAILAAALAGGIAFVLLQKPGRIACASHPAILLIPERHCWQNHSVTVREPLSPRGTTRRGVLTNGATDIVSPVQQLL
jgi:hypothetical protein